MLKKTAFIDSDFMPPTAERFCLIPDTVKNRGYEAVCVRIIDNYPWSFDSRMKSDSAYDEKVIDFLSKKCLAVGLKVILVFPGENDFCRLLRLNSYKRMAASADCLLKIDTEAVGVSSLVESVLEDLTSLCPNLFQIALDSEPDSSSYYSMAAGIIEQNGYGVAKIEDLSKFSTVNLFLDGSDSESDNAFLQLQKAQNHFSNAVFELNRQLTMSLLGCRIPAADSCSLNVSYSAFLEYRKTVESALEMFRRAAAGKLDEDWLTIYLKSVSLTLDAECDDLRQRLVFAGLLN